VRESYQALTRSTSSWRKVISACESQYLQIPSHRILSAYHDCKHRRKMCKEVCWRSVWFRD
jgi:hypothetical protein